MITDQLQSKRAISPEVTPAATHARGMEELLSPWPRITLKMLLIVVSLLAFVAWGLNGTNAQPEELIRGIPYIADFIRRLFPPTFDTVAVPLALPSFQLFGYITPTIGFPETTFPFPQVITAIVETVQMAIIGTILGVILAAPFGLLAARNTSPHPWVYQSMRLVLNGNRALPEIVYALVFVAAVGLGPFGGVLALAVGAVGSMGKLYAEAIESIDPQQVLAVRATGANRMLSFVYGVVPQALPLIASYSLLLFEGNIRHASILGLVGAGGIGFIIGKYMALFQYNRLMGAVILLVVTVTIIDRISDHLRKKII